ncbi:class II aldolase/adducin family protein [Arhodomonas sp. AD133]|uniref:class II aldolase/adducin family protein n=1 Tax=Arhodomonas sp. AD133 TaxID=3415009 RepID=UPI003EBAFDEE
MSTPSTNDLRAELACALRWAARYDLHEAVANHFSVATSDDGTRFLVNPAGRHFSEVRASELVEVDADAAEQPNGVDPTAWCIHGALHRRHPQHRCVLHTHAPAATALSCLQAPQLPPVDQNAMRFYERMAVDTEFDGMGLGEEAERLATLAGGDIAIVLLGNHGVIALGETVAHAFDNLYYFERACRTYLDALATGRPLRLPPPAVARRTAEQWLAYPGLAEDHFAALMRMLDREEPAFRE